MITAHTPKWSDDEHTAIDLIVNFPWIGDEVSFSASASDTESHGRELFIRAEAGEFGAIAAYVSPTSLIPRSSTSLQFMDRFTDAEQLAIVTATLASPQVKLWYDRMIAATEIVYKDPRTLGGLQALVAAGLITAARMDEIVPAAWR
jgi:hypothetical protein